MRILAAGAMGAAAEGTSMDSAAAGAGLATGLPICGAGSEIAVGAPGSAPRLGARSIDTEIGRAHV
jgi:hypothetical protein